MLSPMEAVVTTPIGGLLTSFETGWYLLGLSGDGGEAHEVAPKKIATNANVVKIFLADPIREPPPQCSTYRRELFGCSLHRAR